MKCPNCFFTLTLLEKRRKYKCAKCSRLFSQQDLEEAQFREMNKKARKEDKKEAWREYYREYGKKPAVKAYRKEYYRKKKELAKLQGN